MQPSELILTANLHKLTSSRTWFRKVRPPTWTPTQLTLHKDATLTHKSPTEKSSTVLLVVPGGARPATHHEQLRHDRPHIFAVTTVHVHAIGDRDASQTVLLFAVNDHQQVESWVDAVNEASFARMNVVEEHPGVQPFLHAWGHVLRLRVKEVLVVARDLGFKLTVEKFEEVWRVVHDGVVPDMLIADQFVPVMTHIAIKESMQTMNISAGSPGNVGSVDAKVLSGALGHSFADVKATFERYGVETCTPTLLMHILFHPLNSAIDPEKAAERHDMTRPLNRYLISSSHNTYLEGDQLQSNSTAEMYRVVLEKGCRCVEIDAWDGDEGEPIVRHGHTVTSSETFENVLKAIQEHAFSRGNTCPVILSIENHMCKAQQLIAARMITDVFGDSLYVPSAENKDLDSLPSPASLDRKIIIKAKTGRSVMKPQCSGAGGSADYEDDDSDEPDSPADKLAVTSSGSTDPASSAAEGKIVPELSELTFLAGGNRKALTALWKEGTSGKDRYVAASCVSINEKKLLEVYQADCSAVIREYNSHGLTRVYPKGTRVDSSNYNPMLGHFLGCQIVALNWQSCDSAFCVSEARFLANNGCGYVLPPQVPDAELSGVLQIQILSAFLLPKPKSAIKRDILDPYCWLRVYDTKFDEDGECCSCDFMTDVVKSNGFAPSWQQTVSVPIVNRAMAVLYFKIMDRDRTSGDDVVGHLAVPVCLLRTGVRSLPLNGKTGPLKIPGCAQQPALLCDIRWK